MGTAKSFKALATSPEQQYLVEVSLAEAPWSMEALLAEASLAEVSLAEVSLAEAQCLVEAALLQAHVSSVAAPLLVEVHLVSVAPPQLLVQAQLFLVAAHWLVEEWLGQCLLQMLLVVE